MNFQLQDATGAITVFGSNDDINAVLTGLNVGDSMSLSGTTGSFNGLFQLQAAFTVESSSAGPRYPCSYGYDDRRLPRR